MATAKAKSKSVDITTGVGIACFPHLTKSQADANKNDKGEPRYDVMLMIPKTQREDLKAIFAAIKEVGVDKWGDKWKQMKNPLRDGDAEADELTEDGSTKGEKYPERLGHYFINAKSSRPVGVYNRQRDPIPSEDIETEVYGGCKVKINVGFYTYSNSGNHGIAAGLNGVQKVADGTPFGGGRPSVESMFDMLEDEDDELDFEDETEVEETPAPAKKTAAKKAAPAAKKAVAKKAAPVEEIEADDEDEAPEDDLFDDLDD